DSRKPSSLSDERPPPRSGADKSFEDLIGAEQQRRRDRQSKRFRGLRVQDELELRRLLDGQLRIRGCVALPGIRTSPATAKPEPLEGLRSGRLWRLVAPRYPATWREWRRRPSR